MWHVFARCDEVAGTAGGCVPWRGGWLCALKGWWADACHDRAGLACREGVGTGGELACGSAEAAAETCKA